jgi:anti-anti-sigma regulatory factor
MPFSIDGARVTLAGQCSVEEAPELFQALIAIERPVFDLAQVAYMHTAVAQVLIASRGRLQAPPADRVLEACLAAIADRR